MRLKFYLCFFNISNGWLAKLSEKKYSHCCVLISGKLGWYWIKPTHSSIEFEEIYVSKDQRFEERLSSIRGLTEVIGIQLLYLPCRQKIPWPFIFNFACHSICKRIMQLDIQWIRSPKHLRDKIIMNDKKRNYEIIYRWEK